MRPSSDCRQFSVDQHTPFGARTAPKHGAFLFKDLRPALVNLISSPTRLTSGMPLRVPSVAIRDTDDDAKLFNGHDLDF